MRFKQIPWTFGFLLLSLLWGKDALAQSDSGMTDYSQDTYEQEWEKIDSLDREGLWRSALEAVEDLYGRARADNNPAQVIKTVIYRSKYEAQLSEDGLVQVIGKLEKELQGATFPVRPILQSMLGELYQGYVDQNSWSFSDRTTVVDYDSQDIQTWSIEQLNERILQLFEASVQDERLKQVPIENFEEITTESSNVEGLRPTLYDFLVHRAIDQFRNERIYITQPAYAFDIRDTVAFADISTFIEHNFQTRDTNSYHYQTLLLFQDLLAFHEDDEDPAALVDADLKRLDFVYDQAVLAKKDTFFLQALRQLRENYSAYPIVTKADYRLARWHYEQGRQYDPPHAKQYQWEYKAAKAICEQALSAYPESYGAKQCRQLEEQILQPVLNVQTEQVNISGKPLLTHISYRNLKQAHFRIVQLEESDRDSLDRVGIDKKLTYLKKKKALQTWTVALPEVGDFQQHSTEIGLDPLPLGMYALMSGGSAQLTTEASPAGILFFHVSNIGSLERSAVPEGSDFAVVHRDSGKPLEGVKASFYVRQYNRSTREQEYRLVSSTTSDAEGFVRPDLPENGYYQVKYELGDDQLFIREGFSNYSRYYMPSQENQRTHFFLDRAIYRPGQTVYFKGIALAQNSDEAPRILVDREATVKLYDVNRQLVDELTLRSNEYGTFSGSFRAPEGGLRGQMTLESSIGPSSTSFRVEEYKRPRFEVTYNPLDQAYDLGDQVDVSGQAKAYAGSNIGGAPVQYRVVRQVRFPWWPVWRSGRISPPPGSQEMEIANGVTTTGEDGSFAFSFTAIPDASIPKERNPAFTYRIYAEVTDITGETQTAEKSVTLAYLGLKASVQTPKQADRTKPLTLPVRTTNLDGQPIASDVDLKIYRLDAPDQVFINRYWRQPDQPLMDETDFRRRFPFYPYAQEDEPHTWSHAEEVLVEQFNTGELDTVSANTEAWPVGHYEVHLTTKDSEGQEIEVKQFFTLYDSEQGAVPATTLGWQDLEDGPFEPGATAHLRLATSADELYVRYDLERARGELIRGGWLNVKDWTAVGYEVEEADRGNLHSHVAYVKHNRAYSWTGRIQVPWSNKELEIEYFSFREKLRPGAEENWQLKIKGPAGEQVAAEIVATLYDASLDQFVRHDWSFQPFPIHNYVVRNWSSRYFAAADGAFYNPRPSREEDRKVQRYRHLNWFNFFRYGAIAGEMVQYRAMADSAMPAARMETLQGAPMEEAEASAKTQAEPAPPPTEPETPEAEEPAPVQVRTNLDETVFFLPELRTDTEGNILINFTMNEALTRWKFLGLAHTKELAYALTQQEVVTQKELMVLPNAPRFVREGDEIEFVAKVSNLTETTQAGAATLQLFDGLTMEPVDAALGNEQPEVSFEAGPGQSARVAWKLEIPKGKVSLLVHRVIAKAGAYSDGEEDALPVLTNRTLVTESMPITVRGKEKNTFTFERLEQAARSPSLEQHTLTLEFTSNPAWFAVKALPYLMEYPHECSEQIFSRLYANSLARAVVANHPRIEKIFDAWRAEGGLESELMRNQELKAVLLEETPWVLQAQSETEQRKNIALLFDLDRMQRERETALRKLIELQQSGGGFAWFAGGRENWFITQYIVEGMGRLRALEVIDTQQQDAGAMIRNAIDFIDRKIHEHYNKLQEGAKEGRTDLSEDHLSHLSAHYLYARSYFPEIPKEKPVEEAFTYFMEQAEKYWLDKGIYEQGLIAVATHRGDRKDTALRITRSLRERALRNEELGMYWKYPRGWYWHQLPIETHALMVEVFAEVAQDAETVDELRIWLLKNKQVNHWETTKATAAAVYALFNQGESLATDWLTESEQVEVDFAGVKKKYYQPELEEAENEAEAGTGNFQVTWKGTEIRTDMNRIRVKNPNPHIAWGSLHWQYFEDLDKISTFREAPLNIVKQLYRQQASETGPQLLEVTPRTRLTPGDLLTVRIELRVDRDMEYIHMKDLRASGLEPVNVLSQYKWQGGLGYYESTGDAATHFFIDYLPRGTYVFEYPLRVAHQGDFSNGISTIQSMYAPEFNSHSEGVRIQVAAEEN